jgi:hypothetical protein
MSDKFHLTREERASPLWARVREILEERIAKHRLANDSDRPPEETAKLRGRIAELKDLLKLEKDPPQAPEE